MGGHLDSYRHRLGSCCHEKVQRDAQGQTSDGNDTTEGKYIGDIYLTTQSGKCRAIAADYLDSNETRFERRAHSRITPSTDNSKNS